MTQEHELETASFWQGIFLKSKVNGAPHAEQQLDCKWPWPENTYFQRRLEYLRSPDDLWQPGQAPQKEITAAGAAGRDFVVDESIGTPPQPIYIDVPSDDWTWCANPVSDGRNYAT